MVTLSLPEFNLRLVEARFDASAPILRRAVSAPDPSCHSALFRGQPLLQHTVASGRATGELLSWSLRKVSAYEPEQSSGVPFGCHPALRNREGSPWPAFTVREGTMRRDGPNFFSSAGPSANRSLLGSSIRYTGIFMLLTFRGVDW